MTYPAARSAVWRRWQRCRAFTLAANGEFITACIAAGWAVLMWLPGGSFAEGSGFAAIETAVGGEGRVAAVVTLLAAAQFAGLLVGRWPPRWRAQNIFACSLWWTFAAIEAALGRWQSPSWVTLTGIAWLAWATWRKLRLEQVHVQADEQEAAGIRSRTGRAA